MQLLIKNLKIGLLLSILTVTQAMALDSWYATPSGAGDCSQANPCNLTTALSTATGSDNIYLASGNYTSSGDEVVHIDKNIALLGGWDGTTNSPAIRDTTLHVSVIYGQSVRRGIFIEPDLSVIIDGLSIVSCEHNESGAGLYDENATLLRLNDVTFFGNFAYSSELHSGYGGGAYIKGGIVNIDNSSFIKNAVSSPLPHGGALVILEANSTIKNSLFQENDGWVDSALYVKGVIPLNSSTLLLQNNIFISNGMRTSIAEKTSGYNIFTIANIIAEVYDNTITNNKSQHGDLINFSSSSFSFSRNTISNNSAKWSAALYVSGSPTFQVVNNIIVDNNSTSQDDYPAVHILSSQGLFAQNTIANNNTDFALLLGNVGSSSTDDIGMVNNIITGHPVGIHAVQDSKLGIYSTLWGEGASENGINLEGTGTITHVTDIVGNPAFVNPANGDYHISSNSAAKNAGEVSGISTDIDGDLRPNGGAYDIGADEFVNNLTSPALIMYLLN